MKIRIHGIKDGNHNVELSNNVDVFSDIFPEFVGEVKLTGILTKTNNRFYFNGEAKCLAKLICDLSLEEFETEIKAEVIVNFIVDTELYLLQKQSNIETEEIIIHNDETHFDITNEVKDALVVNLPMKRVATKYKDKTFAELHPEHNRKTEIIDKRWLALKDISFN